MTDEEAQAYCDEKTSELLDLAYKSISVPAWRITILTGVLGTAASEAGIHREDVINALNSVFDYIEYGEIPGRKP